jgi:hypothetical protein
VFEPDVAYYPPGAQSRQLCLASWARRRIERELDARGALTVLRELEGKQLVMRQFMQAARGGGTAGDPLPGLSTEEWRVVHALRTPRRFEELRELARSPRYQLLALVYFLRAVGAVELFGAASPGAHATAPLPAGAARLLGVPSNADAGAIKQAYHRLARRLHPDLHPRASLEHRRALEFRLAELNCAYRELLRSRTA